MNRALKALPLLLVTLALTAQNGNTPPSPKLMIYYGAASWTSWQWIPVTVDPPLTFTVDADGQHAHLSGNAITPRTQRDVFLSAVGTYTLSQTPVPNVAVQVYLNGLLQAPYSYTLNGTTLTFLFTIDDPTPQIQALYAY